jgi:hypothetical protein
MSEKDDILGIDDAAYDEVTVPEWGGRVIRLRSMTAAERDSYQASMLRQQGNNPGNQRLTLNDVTANLLVRCIVDADGNRIFSDKDAAALGRKNAKALDRLSDVAKKLSAMSDEDMEELAGNSEGGQNGDSPTD